MGASAQDENAAEVLKAVQSVVAESKRKPEYFWTDSGNEFVNKDFEKWRDANGIGLYHTYGREKSVIVERFNRTLKTMMWSELTAKNTHAWVPILQELVARCNNTKHGRLKMTPTYASSHPEAAGKRWNLLRKKQTASHTTSPTFEVGDWVRVSRVKAPARTAQCPARAPARTC